MPSGAHASCSPLLCDKVLDVPGGLSESALSLYVRAGRTRNRLPLGSKIVTR